MRLLVLGGTGFVGRHLVAAALVREHEVTIFNRGVTRPGLFPSIEQRRGDRHTGDLAALADGEWDAVVDLAIIPRQVADTADLLGGRVGRYAYVSTVSTYRDLDRAGLDEDAALKDPAGVVDGEVVTVDNYGEFKVACETEVRSRYPADHLIIRAGAMAGPFDNTDRFTYWVRHLARGEPVLAPARPHQPVQLIHARDHARFLLDQLANAQTGVFNVVGPTVSFAEMLTACADAAGTKPQVVWAPQRFLDEQQLRLPLEILESDQGDGIFQISGERAAAAGLVTRPLVETASQVLEWDRRRGGDLRNVRGVSWDQEAAMIQLLQGRTGRRRTPSSPLGLQIGPEVAADQPIAPAGGEPVTPRRCCLIATTPRTGSWLLADLLNATGLVGRPQEYFRVDFVRAFSRRLGLDSREITAEYLAGIFASTSPETGIFSVKMQPYDRVRLLEALRAMDPAAADASPSALVEQRFPDPRYVSLIRRDTQRQAISWYRSLLSNVWWQFAGEQDQLAGPRYPDFLQVKWLEDWLVRDQAEWEDFFAEGGIESHPVAYEDLVADPEGVLRGVFAFLSVELPDDFELPETQLKKMADEDTEIWVDAYRTVRDALPPLPEGWYWSPDHLAFVSPTQS